MSRLCELKAAGGAELMTAINAAFPKPPATTGLRRVARRGTLSRVFAYEWQSKDLRDAECARVANIRTYKWAFWRIGAT